LITHPDTQTREQAQRILYIMKAPKLERPKEWMSEIPDLATADQSTSRYVGAKKKPTSQPQAIEFEDLPPAPTDSQDNQFVWFAVFVDSLDSGNFRGARLVVLSSKPRNRSVKLSLITKFFCRAGDRKFSQ